VSFLEGVDGHPGAAAADGAAAEETTKCKSFAGTARRESLAHAVLAQPVTPIRRNRSLKCKIRGPFIVSSGCGTGTAIAAAIRDAQPMPRSTSEPTSERDT